MVGGETVPRSGFAAVAARNALASPMYSCRSRVALQENEFMRNDGCGHAARTQNVHFFATLLSEVASQLDVPLGEYTHFISSVCHDRSAEQC